MERRRRKQKSWVVRTSSYKTISVRFPFFSSSSSPSFRNKFGLRKEMENLSFIGFNLHFYLNTWPKYNKQTATIINVKKFHERWCPFSIHLALRTHTHTQMKSQLTFQIWWMVGVDLSFIWFEQVNGNNKMNFSIIEQFFFCIWIAIQNNWNVHGI